MWGFLFILPHGLATPRIEEAWQGGRGCAAARIRTGSVQALARSYFRSSRNLRISARIASSTSSAVIAQT